MSHESVKGDPNPLYCTPSILVLVLLNFSNVCYKDCPKRQNLSYLGDFPVTIATKNTKVNNKLIWKLRCNHSYSF